MSSAPQMALGPKGEIGVVWGRDDIFFSQSTDGGATFSVPLKLNVTSVETGGPRIAVAPDDTIYVVWAACNIFFTKSTDSGASFSVTSNVPNSGCVFDELQVSTDGTGNVNTLWRNDSPSQDVFFSRSTNGGSTFPAPLDLSNGSGFQPQMFLDPSGNLNVVWAQTVSGTSGAVIFRRSSDGTSFPPAKTVNAPGPVGVLAASSPQIAVDPKGNIDIAWQQGAPGTDDADDTLFSFSADAGANFSQPVRASQKAAILAGTVQMALGAAGDVNIIWSDPPNLFFSRATSGASSSADFTISAAPASLVVLPGGAATTQVTLTSTGGFNQAVNLTCSKLTPGAACSFDSASVTPTDSGAKVKVTLTIPPTMAQGNFTFTLTAASGNTTHTQDMQVAVGGLSGSVAPAAMTIAAGSASNFTVMVNSTGGFSGQVSLACSGAPAGVACSFGPPQFSVQANATATSTLTVQVSTKPSGSLSPKNRLQVLPTTNEILPIASFVFLLSFTVAFALARGVNGSRARIARALGAIVLTIALAAAMVSCGGATTSSAGGGGGTGASGSGGAGSTGGTSSAGGSGSGGSGAGAGGGTGGSTSVSFPISVQAQSAGATVNLGTATITVP